MMMMMMIRYDYDDVSSLHSFAIFTVPYSLLHQEGIFFILTFSMFLLNCSWKHLELLISAIMSSLKNLTFRLFLKSS